MKHRGCSLVLTFTLIVIQVPLSAQEYFDQNRVRYRTVDFENPQNSAFRYLLYDEEKAATEDVARMSGRQDAGTHVFRKY